MRTFSLCSSLFILLATSLLAATAAPAAAPPAGGRVKGLIELLGDDSLRVRTAAALKLEALGEEVLPALRRAARTHADVDVRLRALVIAAAIEKGIRGEIRAFGLGSHLRTAPPGLGYWLNRVAFSGDGKYAVAGGGGLILFDLETGKEVRRVLEVGGPRPGLAMSGDGRHCLTGHGNDANCHLVEVPSLRIVRTFGGHVGGVKGVALAADGTRAASAGADGGVRLWDVKTGKELKRLTHLGRSVPSCVAFSADGRRLLAGWASSVNGPIVCLYEVETGRLLRALPRHGGAVTAVAFLPDGRSALSASMDGIVRLWDLASGKEVRRMTHTGGIHDAAVSSDGKRALTAGWGDRRVRLWDLGTGRQLYAFDGHVAPVLGVAFSPDGKRALSSDAVCCVRLWRLSK
jgi:WD40 repeat protein